MGHKKRKASRDIRFANALPVLDGPAFAAYIRDMLIPEIAPGIAVILDNLATHRNKEADPLFCAHGCWFRFSPPYAPRFQIVWFMSSKRAGGR